MSEILLLPWSSDMDTKKLMSTSESALSVVLHTSVSKSLHDKASAASTSSLPSSVPG